MRIKILYLGLIRHKVGKKEEEYEISEGSSLSDLLNSLAHTYNNLERIVNVGDHSRLDPTFIVTINGKLEDPFRGGNVTLNAGDTVALMTLISGG